MVILLTVGMFAPAGAVGAQTPPDGEFNNGAGDTLATVMSAKALAGSTALGIDFGVAIAKYQGGVGIAEGRGFDLGLLEALLGTSCDGSPPAIDPAAIMQGIRVDSRNTEPLQLEPTQVVGIGANPKSVGTQWAGATPQPWAHAGTEILPLNFGMKMEGGRNSVVTEVKDHIRMATATVKADRIVFMGVLAIDDPEWKAVVRTGDAQETSGSFTFSKARIFGIELDPKNAEKNIKSGLADWNEMFADLGLRFDYPEVVVTGNRVEVTPLAIRLVDSPAGKRGVGPFLEAIQPLRRILFEYLLELDCNFATTVTIIDVVFGILSGAGGIHITSGGVKAEIDDSFFENPFGAGFGAVGAAPAPLTPAASPGTTTPPPASPATPPVQNQAIASPSVQPTASREEMPGDTDPATALAAGVLLAAIVALALGDFLWMRRTHRRIPDS
ncbi:MAG: hypothetical protein IT198_08155 [Acidimicrobiia bacterium]|nr:hypothetical protein [Acidimicrobiia bacterium]